MWFYIISRGHRSSILQENVYGVLLKGVFHSLLSCHLCRRQGLRRVALKGVTVAAVIHQPSYETFCMFDDLVLLAKGGRTAYYGPQASVQVRPGNK
jgi:hypothetical protein